MTKEDILSLTQNGLSVFRHYIKGDWRLGKNFRNPFYEDKNASCNVYLDKRTGLYKIKDFGNPYYAGDCFAFVAKIGNLDCGRDFFEILEKINRDLGLSLDSDKPMPNQFTAKDVSEVKMDEEREPEDRSQVFPPVKKQFSESELRFWAEYGIDGTILSKYNVVSVVEFSGISKADNSYTYKSSEAQPIFAYVRKKSVKYYMPFSSTRFLYAQKTEHLPTKGETVFITGGEKDVMSLRAHGFSAICFNSETSNIPKGIIKNLSYRFKHIVLLYDCDKTGLEASEKHCRLLKEFQVKRLVLPLGGTKTDKDVSDYFASGKTRNDLMRLFTLLLKGEYADTFALLKPCAIDFDNPPARPEPLVVINNVVIASPANILSITGSEGSGKSNYVGAIVAGALCVTVNDEVDTLGTYVAPNTLQKALLMYDTEQTEDQLYRNAKTFFAERE